MVVLTSSLSVRFLYLVFIVAKIEANLPYLTRNIKEDVSENNIPDIWNISIIGYSQTEVNVSIILTTDVFRPPIDIVVNCSSNDEWDWVVKAANYILSINNSTQEFSLGNLSMFTNYTCFFKVTGGNSTVLSMKTAEDVPSQPENVTISNSTSFSFKFIWDEPKIIPTTLLGYNISVIRGNMISDNHYWSHCINETEGNYSTYVDKRFFHFEKALPDFEYAIMVWAWSTAGLGSPNNQNVSTLAAGSESPQNVNHSVSEMYNMNNVEMSLNISWNMPCNTNGPVNYFVVELSGYYNNNKSIVHKFSDQNIKIIKNSSEEIYNYSIPNLMAASNYTLQIYAITNNSSSIINGTAYDYVFTTNDNYPSAPEFDNNETFITANNLYLSWEEPNNNPGSIKGYELDVHCPEVNWTQTNHCVIEDCKNNVTYLQEREHSIKVIPSSEYRVDICAETSRGKGNATTNLFTSDMDYPEKPSISKEFSNETTQEADQYTVRGNIEFIPRCFNGQFDSYEVSFKGQKTGNNDHCGSEVIGNYENTTYSFTLKAEYFYTVNVTVKNSKYGSTSTINFTSPAGVPLFNKSIISNIIPVVSTNEAVLTLNKTYFENEHGKIRYIAIIVSSDNVTGGDFFEWKNNSQWPDPDADDAEIYYQATPKFWNPFVESNTIEYVVGQDHNCSENKQFCNGRLRSNKKYFVFIRLFNANWFRNTMPVTFLTDSVSKVGLILEIIFSLLGVSALGFIVFILWRKGVFHIANKGCDSTSGSQHEISISNSDRDPLILNFFKKKQQMNYLKIRVSKDKFAECCNYLENNPNELNKQWQNLEVKSDEVYDGLQNNFALLPENKRKNRYTNILPFDHSRVKLNIDEDDEICSDYINASYIKGFSNQHEYIATQGPLPHTVRDFWKMIFQANVSVIIMVARFVENKREKCFKYFPNNHEAMLYGDDIEVKCCTELDFQIYCVRTLQIRKDVKQITVTHMQFLEWPDFGVPNGTDDMLHFCHQWRERWKNEGGLTVVHCSAGVGRTGTIIATDILMRAIEANREIDVFNTVLELRSQRRCMVQTEKQYMYIYQLIRSFLEDPIPDDENDSEHVYENVGFKNVLVESAL